MIIDEAYQATFADVSNASDDAQQILKVGDPGQIGPVVTADVSAFRGRETAPHMRAPEVFARMKNAEIHSLDTTYRLGQETVDAIAPLYDFPFSSSRPDRYLTDADGDRVSEIVPLLLDPSPTFDHLPTLVAVAEYSAGLIGAELVEFDEDDQPFTRQLVPSDIAIVVAHNAQASGITAILRSLKADGIHVGTADKMQGGQWHAVVAMDPFIGYTSAGSHQLSPGRLCVMASRHQTHMTWVHDGDWGNGTAGPGHRPERSQARPPRPHRADRRVGVWVMSGFLRRSGLRRRRLRPARGSASLPRAQSFAHPALSGGPLAFWL